MSKYIKLEDAIYADCILINEIECDDCPFYDEEYVLCRMVKWLESLPTIEVSEDAISREYLFSKVYDMDNDDLVVDLKDIEDAPSVIPKAKEGEWIPCSERMPEDIRPVLVTWKNTDPASYYQYIVGKHFIGTAHYHKGKWYWYSSVTEDLLAEYGKCDSEEFDEAIEAVAWMPLPKPWKGADDEV